MMHLPRTCLLAFLMSLTGCYAATSAAVHRDDQPGLRGIIEGGDSTHMVVRNAAGEMFRVPRAGVVDIDHPSWTIAAGLFTIGIPGGLYGLYLWNQSTQAASSVADAAHWQSVPAAPDEIEVVP